MNSSGISIAKTSDKKLLQVFDDIKNSIAEIDDIKELHSLRDLASGYETAWKSNYMRSGFGKSHMRLGWETKFRCEHKMGELLKGMELNKKFRGNQRAKSQSATNLSDLGITKNQSYKYQLLSLLKPKKRDKYITKQTTERDEPTSAGAYSKAKKIKKKKEEKEVDTSKFKKQVLQGDCSETIKKIPDNSIDMIYVDPPYNVGVDEWDKFTEEDFINFTGDWVLHCLRVLKDQSNLYIHFPADKIKWLEEYIRTLAEIIPTTTIIWHYRNLVRGRDSKNKYLSTYQPILHYNFGDKPLNFDPEWNDERFDVWTIATPQTNFIEGKDHITQKPLELMERIVRTGSIKGEKVLDPMAGSGTTGVACLKNDRDFVLIEREQKYIDIIHKRLNDVC